AVELGVRVLDNVDTHTDDVHRVVFRDGRVTRHWLRVKQTTYSFDNKSETEQTLYLDHPREDPSWQLADTPAPAETTENYWRFKLPLPAKRLTRFVVRQRWPVQQSQALTEVDTSTLAAWLEQRHLDARTAQVLREVIDAQGQLAELEGQLER